MIIKPLLEVRPTKKYSKYTFVWWRDHWEIRNIQTLELVYKGSIDQCVLQLYMLEFVYQGLYVSDPTRTVMIKDIHYDL